MDFLKLLMSEREKRKALTRENEKVLQAIVKVIRDERAHDDRWQVRADQNAPMFVSNSEVDVLFRTTCQYEDMSAMMQFKLVVRDGGQVDIKNLRGDVIATGNGPEEALGHMARLVAEFEWPDDINSDHHLRLK